MTKRTTPAPEVAARRIHGPAELLQAVPYLLGFHPRRSLVLVGLHDGGLVVTARLDLADAAHAGLLTASLQSMCDGGTNELIAAVYDDGDDCAAPAWSGGVDDVVEALVAAVADLPCRIVDVLHVAAGRWWAHGCGDVGCCPPGGNPLPSAPSAFAAAATVDGVVPLPDRAALAAVLAPLPPARRADLAPALARAGQAARAAVVEGRGARHERAVKRALFAAARACDEAEWDTPDDSLVARFALALTTTSMRDAVWLAVDDRRLDGRVLWRELARRAPEPLDAPALFLYGWATWRAGNTALAGIAAERALRSDPDYNAADLLLAALSQGVDPRRMPRLRRTA